MELIFRLFCTEEARNQIFFSACLTGKQDRQPLSVLMQLLSTKIQQQFVTVDLCVEGRAIVITVTGAGSIRLFPEQALDP